MQNAVSQRSSAADPWFSSRGLCNDVPLPHSGRFCTPALSALPIATAHHMTITAHIIHASYRRMRRFCSAFLQEISAHRAPSSQSEVSRRGRCRRPGWSATRQHSVTRKAAFEAACRALAQDQPPVPLVRIYAARLCWAESEWWWQAIGRNVATSVLYVASRKSQDGIRSEGGRARAQGTRIFDSVPCGSAGHGDFAAVGHLDLHTAWLHGRAEGWTWLFFSAMYLATARGCCCISISISIATGELVGELPLASSYTCAYKQASL